MGFHYFIFFLGVFLVCVCVCVRVCVCVSNMIYISSFIELFLVSTSAPRLVLQRYVLSCLWDGAYKRPLVAKRKEATEGFLSLYLSSPLPYVRPHITVNKMC